MSPISKKLKAKRPIKYATIIDSGINNIVTFKNGLYVSVVRDDIYFKSDKPIKYLNDIDTILINDILKLNRYGRRHNFILVECGYFHHHHYSYDDMVNIKCYFQYNVGRIGIAIRESDIRITLTRYYYMQSITKNYKSIISLSDYSYDSLMKAMNQAIAFIDLHSEDVTN